MKKARWLLWSAAVVLAVTVFSIVPSPQPEAPSFDTPFILDLTSSTPTHCAVHRVPMQVAKIPVVFGLPVADDAIPTERFPHSRAIAQGGCGVLPATETWVYVCPDCQRAENEWKLAQQTPK